MNMTFFSTVILICCLISLSDAGGKFNIEDNGEYGGNVEQYVWNIISPGAGFGNVPSNKCIRDKLLELLNNSSTVYTRWGRNDCPDTSDLVFTGYIAGGNGCYKGAGKNAQCMPTTPDKSDRLQSGSGSRAYLYGAEYETAGYVSAFAQVNNGDAVCAVCRARGKSTNLMIPAKRNCPSDWTKEYEGLLMGSKSTYYGSEYICVDANPEMRQSSTGNNIGFLLYPIEGKTSPLPSPYINGYELSCVVCTV
ncbi:uncharacterized protein [Antedon mediterranea]|uniref:uncharacterized protein n=1 Tax=Antedon mediterranea TaxID=105859 RepID=UPI003AF4C312